jgi:hypothetical protein
MSCNGAGLHLDVLIEAVASGGVAGIARRASIFSLLAQSKDTKRNGTPDTSAFGGPEMC